jgi:hypothetical protein
MLALDRPFPDTFDFDWNYLPLILILLFFSGFAELGWCGYTLDPMQQNFGALGSSLSIGIF